MFIDIAALKNSSRVIMRETRPGVYPVAVLYIVITTVISSLIAVLSGATEFYRNAMTAISMNTAVTYGDLINLMPRPQLISEILIVVLSLTSMIVGAGYEFYCLKVSRRVAASYRDVVSGFNELGKVVAICVLRAVFVFLWSLLFVIPGIVAAYRYSMAFYVLYDHPEMSAMDCIRESKRLMRGNKGLLFVTHLSFLGWIILSSVIASVLGMLLNFSFPILDIYIAPYMGITEANFYNALLIHDGQQPNADFTSSDRYDL